MENNNVHYSTIRLVFREMAAFDWVPLLHGSQQTFYQVSSLNLNKFPVALILAMTMNQRPITLS